MTARPARQATKGEYHDSSTQQVPVDLQDAFGRSVPLVFMEPGGGSADADIESNAHTDADEQSMSHGNALPWYIREDLPDAG